MPSRNHFKTRGRAIWIIAVVTIAVTVAIWVAVHNLSSPGKFIKLSPSNTGLGNQIKLEYGRYNPPIWMREGEVVQGDSDAPWLEAARGSLVRPGNPAENVAPFVTESFMQDDFSPAAYKKSQEIMKEHPGMVVERTAFHWIEVQTGEGRFMIVVGVGRQLLDAPPPDRNSISAKLYQYQHGRWLITSTRRYISLLSLPWKDLNEIERIIEAGSAKKNDFGVWEAVESQ